MACRLWLYFWLPDGQLVIRYSTPNHYSKSLSKKRRMLRQIEFRFQHGNLELSVASLKTEDGDPETGCLFYILRFLCFSGPTLLRWIESILIRATQQWFADRYYAVLRCDPGELGKAECLDMDSCHRGHWANSDHCLSKMIKWSITNQFLDTIPPTGLS